MEDIRVGMTEEEIKEHMRKEAEELDGYIGRFVTANPTPAERAEEEEEDVIQLDLEKGTALQVESTIVTRERDEEVDLMFPSPTFTTISNGLTEQQVEALIAKALTEKEEPAVYQKLSKRINDTFTRRAISQIIKKLSDEARRLDSQNNAGYRRTYESVFKSIQELDKMNDELRLSIKYGVVNYDIIPEWALDEIQENIDEMILNLSILSER